jgi:alpha-L-rhamnosidase
MHRYQSVHACIGICILLSVIISNQTSAQINTGESKKLFEKAIWIGAKEKEVIVDSLMYGDFPAPLFRREFSINSKIEKAALSITAAGYYLVSVNGKSLENNVLDPAWTNFSKRIYYSTYDVTSLLKNGVNAVGVELGNGFYNLLPIKMFGRNLRVFLPTGEPQWIARLELEYANGSLQEIVTDTNWKVADGPVTKNNVYLGVHYDARKELKGWNLPGFDDKMWKNTVKMNGPGGELQPAFFPEVKVTKTIQPFNISQSGKKIIVDMGVNLTGLYKIKLRGEPGDTVHFRFGERLYENGTLNPMTTVAGQVKQKGRGGPGAPAIAWQTDSYVFGLDKEAIFEPRFAFHTYRYIEITGLKYIPQKEDINALFFHTAVENQNQFSCSTPLLNEIQKACRQTFLDNLITVQSDCPAREKFGYGGDLNATSETFIYNYDMQSFYRKTIYDWVDAMQDSIFIDTAPYVGIAYCGISWESAFLTTQYKLYQYYGDTAIIHELYQKDLNWMDKVKRMHPDELIDKGLSDHESLEKVPVQLIGTTHYLECARIMKRFAELKHDMANVQRFSTLEQSLTRKLLDKFWYKPVTGPINRQTLFSTMIYYQIIPQKELPAATDSLLKAVRSAPAGHFTTGIFGTKYILEALSMTGHTEEVYKIVNSTSYPGWGFMIDKGATTIWETWKESDNVYSNCHPMFGTVSEWFYRYLAGIRPLADSPGFKRFILAPEFPEGLNHAEAVYHAPTGDIKVNWMRIAGDKIELKVSVPKGTIAEFQPAWKARKMRKVTNVNTNYSFEIKSGTSMIELKNGTYLIN